MVQAIFICFGLCERIDQIIQNSFLVEFLTSFHGIFSEIFFCFGLIMRYLAPSRTLWRSTFCIVSTIYSFTCSLFQRWIEIRKLLISSIDTVSTELSKYRMVKIKNPVIINPRMIMANPGLRLKITHETRSHMRQPIQNVILLRASISPYSLGSALERTYP